MPANKSPRSLLILTHEFDPRRGGIATYCEEIALAAQASGQLVEVWTHSDIEGRSRAWPFAVRRLPMKGTQGWRCQLATLRALISSRHHLRDTTVLLAEPGPMLACMWLIAFGVGLPRNLLLTFHGSEILRFHHNPLTRFFTRALICRATRISTLTHYTHDLLCSRFPEAGGKTVLTPGAVRSTLPACAKLNSRDPAPILMPSPTSPGRLVVLTVGRLHPRKGQRHTLRALDALPAELRDQVEYWIVGKAAGSHYEHLLRLAAAKASLRVRFHGELDDAQLDRVYRRADIFALTGTPHGRSIEGFGLVYLDAAAYGLPVVAHGIGGVPEAVDDGVTGLLVSHSDPGALTAAFARLITDSDLRRRLAAAGPAWAKKKHVAKGRRDALRFRSRR